MITIAQIAEKTGYSPSTVSIVLRGLGTQRAIPESTQGVILGAARELGYRPNVSARRLRSDEPQKQNIAIFWATDFRGILVAKFLQGVQRYITERELEMEVTVIPYTPNQISRAATQRTLNMYSGVIICTASTHDLEYLEQLTTACPLVLYNRTSEKFSSVGVDNEAVGRLAAQKFINDGCDSAIVVADDAETTYSKARLDGFVHTLAEANISTHELYIRDNTIAQGRNCITPQDLNGNCTGIFVSSDMLAIGVLNKLTSEGIIFPDRAELITVGTSDAELYQCLTPSLAVISIPIEEMAYRCTEVLHHVITDLSYEITRIYVPFEALPGTSTK